MQAQLRGLDSAEQSFHGQLSMRASHCPPCGPTRLRMDYGGIETCRGRDGRTYLERLWRSGVDREMPSPPVLARGNIRLQSRYDGQLRDSDRCLGLEPRVSRTNVYGGAGTLRGSARRTAGCGSAFSVARSSRCFSVISETFMRACTGG